MELETFFEYYPEIHLIAYNDDMSYFIGYELDTHKAFYYNDDTCYSSDLLSHMNDAYIDWASVMIFKLGFSVDTVDNEDIDDYYELIVC